MGKEGNPRKQGIGRGGKIVNVVAETTQPLYEIWGVFFKKIFSTNKQKLWDAMQGQNFFSYPTSRRHEYEKSNHVEISTRS